MRQKMHICHPDNNVPLLVSAVQHPQTQSRLQKRTCMSDNIHMTSFNDASNRFRRLKQGL